MNFSQKASSEIYASFTINKIDPEVRASMTDKQINAVYEALIAAEDSKRHSIDIRGTIPLYLAKYYFVFFAGRDKRKQTLLEETIRNNQGNAKSGLSFAISGALILALIVLLAGGYTAYLLKSELGIDIIPNKHLSDVIKELFSFWP